MIINGIISTSLSQQVAELANIKVDRVSVDYVTDDNASLALITGMAASDKALVKTTGKIHTYVNSSWGSGESGTEGVIYIGGGEQYAYSQNQFFLLTTNNALTLGGVAASSYVQKDGSKGLSTNDYTNADKNKLAGIDIDYNAQTVKANGKELGTINNPILNATSSEFAESADKADADGDGNSITATYATKTELTNGLSGKLNTFQPSDVGKCVIIKNDGTLNPVSSAGMSVGYAENANDANTIDGHEYTDFATASHNHDGRYYTESEIDTALSGKAAASHTHDDRYYTTSQMDAALAAKAPNSHSHTKSQITDFAHEHQITQVTGLTTRLTDIEDDVDSLESSTTGISSALSNHVNASNPHGITAAGIGAALSSHTHGNITNDGKVGSAANKPIITGTNGVLQAGSFGITAGTFCEGNDSRLGNARPASGGTAEYAEKLGSSGGSITYGNINMQFSGINTSLTSLNTAVGNKVADVKIGNTSLLDSNKVASIPFADNSTDGILGHEEYGIFTETAETVSLNADDWSGKQDAISDLATIRSNASAGAAKVSCTDAAIGGYGYTKNAGTVTQVRLGSTPYTPASGVVSLPAYPSTPADVGAAAASHDHDGRYYTETEINTKLDGKASFGFDTVKIGDAEIAATTKEDTLELVAGSNITLDCSIGNKQITISSTGGGGATYTAGDGIRISNNQISAKLERGVLDVDDYGQICFSRYFDEAETEDRNDGYKISITDSRAGDDAITFRLPYATTSKGGVMSKEDKIKLNTLQDYGFRLFAREGVLYVASKNQLDIEGINIQLMRYGRYKVKQIDRREEYKVEYKKKGYRMVGSQYTGLTLSLVYDKQVSSEYYYKVRLTRHGATSNIDDMNIDRLMDWFSAIKLNRGVYRIGIKNGKDGFIMDESKVFYSVKFAIRIIDRVILPFAVVMNSGYISSVTSSEHTPFSDFSGWKLK